MKSALISPDEKVYKYDGTLLGERVAEVTVQPFEVAPPLFWVQCADDVATDQFYWDGNTCVTIPPRPTPVAQLTTATTTGQGGPNVVA